MLYVLICNDKPNSEALRQSVRADHLEHIQKFDVKFAGPMLADDESTMIGSIIVIEADSVDVAYAFAEQDPYARAELFDSVTIRPFKQVVGQ